VGRHGITGQGVLATVRFRAVAAGDPKLAIDRVIGRDATNHEATITIETSLELLAPISATELGPMVPNPSHGNADVQYSVAKRGTVELSIYSVDGRLVRTLARGIQEVGRYHSAWDGTDDRGIALRAGVFYLRLHAEGVHMTRRISLVR